ncbi:GNAT family N-acetyltransferase [Dactylosporangium vinaceum]|uniref:GNAT family N-acetyltransferase n=1 Tax=Dactylosporangium vinaceum TaxID=53362 RepID=A0ABV5MEQ6_9ACTN|nr:GNAT family N-acetyltransferase [Dactylosporangium vinaceum]UAB97139.1 GNAT family N-acetyltransferase [Dactylosporangium vinaceum]
MSPTTLEIAEVRADDPAAVGAVYDLLDAALRADRPELPPMCRYQFERQFEVPPPSLKRSFHLALRSDEPVGAVQLDLPFLDNLDKAHVDLFVRPDARRQGVARALYTRALTAARADGRTSVLGFSPATDGPSGFASAAGLRNGLLDARRRLDLAGVDDAALDAMYAEGLTRSAGYRLVQWQNRLPEEYIEDIAALDSSFLAETPMGEIDYEPEKVDAARLRRLYRAFDAWGSRRYEAGLVHEASGHLVAWTAMRVARTVDWHCWQLITLVHPAHRGHRLGLVAKIANLRALRTAEPAVTTVDTFNAADNPYMIAINEAMGFRFRDDWANWQGPLPAAA